MSIPGDQPNKYVICAFQKYIHFHQNYSFHSLHFHFQFLHQRGLVKLWAPWDYFPTYDIISQSTLSLQNACRSAEGKRKHTHHPCLQCLGRLLALSLTFAVMPSLSPRKFQCTPLPEAPIYLNRWGPGSLCFPKCCCS